MKQLLPHLLIYHVHFLHKKKINLKLVVGRIYENYIAEFNYTCQVGVRKIMAE
jgi:hypothetical protein